MQLKPGEQFTIVRQLDNPADSGTYYVQAVIRNSKTDAILATLELDDKGNQRFTKSWQVSPDPSGEGMYIDVESRVFTDNTYTTYSDVYSKENAVYLVADRPLSMGGFGTEMSQEIDYKKIRTIIGEEISGQDKPKAPKIGLSKVMARIDALQAILEGIEPPEKPEPVDFSPLMSEIKQLSDKIGQLIDSVDSIEPTPETNLSPVLDKIDILDPQNMIDQVNGLVDKMKQLFGTDIGNLEKKITDMHTMIGRAPFIPLPSMPIEEKAEPIVTRKRNILNNHD